MPIAPEHVMLHSRHKAAGVEAWITAHKLQDRVTLVADWPDFGTCKPDAVVVANRAAK